MIFKKMSSHGSINIPVQVRRSLGLQPKDVMELEEQGGKIVIRPREMRCIFCGADEDVIKMKGRGICRSCIKEAQEIEKKGEGQNGRPENTHQRAVGGYADPA